MLPLFGRNATYWTSASNGITKCACCVPRHQQIAELLEWLPVDPVVKLIPAEQLSKESAWYWRHMVRHLHSIQDTDHLDQLLPELIIFTGYVRA